MLLGEYIKSKMPDATELLHMFDPRKDGRVVSQGYLISQMEAAPVDVRALRAHIKAYANGPDGPYTERRLALYHQVHDLFERLADEPSNKGMKGYVLKDSFIGGEEADLIMLTVSHEERSQEDIAHNVLMCSKNAVGERRARIRDGVRIGGMCIAEEFGYRGEFRSSVHPLALPLNLSEVYVLMDALAAYEKENGELSPHGRTARRIAGMIKRELSDYAKKRLGKRLKGMGFSDLQEVDPVFVPDIVADKIPDDLTDHMSSKDANWIFYEKAGRLVRVCLVNGRSVKGTILPRSEHEQFFKDHAQEIGGVTDLADARPKCVVRLGGEKGYAVVDWADVVDIG